MAKKLGLVFEVSGELREIYLSLGIDLPRFNGEDSWTLPLPGRIVIDGAGVIRHVDVDPDYTVRPEPTETVALLQGMAGD